MAGNYPDVPSWRMAYDRDGTQGYLYTYSVVNKQFSQTELQALNDEQHTDIYAAPDDTGLIAVLVLIFPELRDLDAYYFNARLANGYAYMLTAEVSTDTTNGLDGTWTSIGSIANMINRSGAETYRNNIVSTTSLAIKAIRFSGHSSYYNFAFQDVHLYGEPAPGENQKRLEFWHPTLDQRVGAAYFDWGNVPRESSADLPFRIKNMSPDKTAHSIRVAQEALTDTNPSVPAQHLISQDGGQTFGAQQTIGDLAPGAVSDQLIFRRVTPSNAVLSLWTFRLFSTPASWS